MILQVPQADMEKLAERKEVPLLEWTKGITRDWCAHHAVRFRAQEIKSIFHPWLCPQSQTKLESDDTKWLLELLKIELS